jgi:hypothetical protein
MIADPLLVLFLSSAGQTLFLTSILPAEANVFVNRAARLTKGWLGYLHRLMKIMDNRNKINDEQLLDRVRGHHLPGREVAAGSPLDR